MKQCLRFSACARLLQTTEFARNADYFGLGADWSLPAERQLGADWYLLGMKEVRKRENKTSTACLRIGFCLCLAAAATGLLHNCNNSFTPDWQCLGNKDIKLEEIHCVWSYLLQTPDWHCLQKLGFQACSPKPLPRMAERENCRAE